MQLTLIRHAIAVPRAEGRDDAARPLTPKGRERFRRVVRGLERLDVRFDRVVHSPWLRAVETADLVARLSDGGTEVTPLLAAPPTAELLAGLGADRVALVGHSPWLEELLAWLVTGDRAHVDRFALKKGGVARLSGEPAPRGMVLEALWTPRALVAVGGQQR